jgi:hypothetical protein
VKINLVDAAAAGLFLVLLPIAFGAYLLFRTPAPALAGVTPRTLVKGPNQRIEIDGANLRPFMRVSFNTVPARAFLLGSTKYALVDVPDLEPGTYDVVLYDYMQEAARLPNALTIVPLATDVELEVTGAFKAPPDALAAKMKVGDAFPSADRPLVEILAIGGAARGDLRLHVGDRTIRVPQGRQDVAATLRLRCTTDRSPDGAARCIYPGPDQPIVVAPDMLLTVSTPDGPVLFQIGDVRAPVAAGAATIDAARPR